MAEISFNNKFDQMNKLNQQFYDDYFEDNYDPTKPMNQQSNSLTMKSLNDGSTTPDFAAMQSAYNDAQKSKTKNSFFSMSADAAMPDNFSGLQNSMGGLTLNPDGTLNYNNTQPQNLGFTSMVDMANKANNFNSQFASPGRFSGMGQVGPNKSNMNAPAALDMDRFAGVSNLGRNDMDVEQVESLTSPQGILQGLQSKIGAGFNNVKDFAMNKGTQGFNLARQIPGMALSAMTGIPGIGMALGLLGKMGSNEYAQATTANMQKQNNNLQGLGLDGVSNFGGVTTDDLGRITNNGLNYNTPEGIMSGYNSGFDLAGKALGRIGTIQEAIEKGRFKDKFALDRANKKINNLKTAAVASAQAKRQAYQDKIDRAKNQAAQDRARTKSITAGYGGHDNSPGATGPTAAGAGMGYGGGYASDHGFKKDGGMIGYRNGGLASMFTRRR
jgi:hypothetical protein